MFFVECCIPQTQQSTVTMIEPRSDFSLGHIHDLCLSNVAQPSLMIGLSWLKGA